MSDKLILVKLAAQVCASVGVSKIFSDVIANNVTVQTPADVAKVWAGSIVLGSMVAEAASKHVNNRVDAAAAWYESRKDSTPK